MHDTPRESDDLAGKMDERYLTWLLIQERPNGALRDLLLDWRGTYKWDQSARVPVELGLRGGRPYLRTRNVGWLLDEVVKSGKVDAFSFAPAAHLAVAHNQVYFGRTRYVQVLWHGSEELTEKRNHPYFRRFVTLKFLHSRTQTDLELDDAVNVEAGDCDPLRNRLVIRPEPIEFDARRFEPLYWNRAKALKEINALLLPPVRDARSVSSYFEPKRTAIRAALRPMLDAYRRDERPVAVALWRLADDPLVRDLLCDGGSLDVRTGKNKETRVGVRIHAGEASRSSTAMAQARSSLFLEPKAIHGVSWASELGGVLRGDLEMATGGWLDVSHAESPMPWSDPPYAGFDRGGPEEGSWTQLEALKKRLEVDAPGASVDFFGDVLQPTKPGRGGNPDHDGAELRFNGHVFRCPWQTEPPSSWRHVMMDVVADALRDTPMSPGDRVKQQGLSVDALLDDGLHLVHLGHNDPEELRRLRLLLPLGTVFRHRHKLTLDGSSAALDRGYCLA